MRIKLDISKTRDVQLAALQVWVESHADGNKDFFIAINPTIDNDVLVFQFEYNWMLGCHRLFILDPISDELLSFFAEDFTDIGRWIFKRCDEHFVSDYEILM